MFLQQAKNAVIGKGTKQRVLALFCQFFALIWVSLLSEKTIPLFIDVLEIVGVKMISTTDHEVDGLLIYRTV